MNQVFARVPFFILPSTVIDMIRWNSAVFTRFLFCRCPRRIPLLIFFVIGGTACITAGVIPFIWKTSNCKYSCPVCVVHVHSEEGGGGVLNWGVNWIYGHSPDHFLLQLLTDRGSSQGVRLWVNLEPVGCSAWPFCTLLNCILQLSGKTEVQGVVVRYFKFTQAILLFCLFMEIWNVSYILGTRIFSTHVFFFILLPLQTVPPILKFAHAER